jgi:hypothetical protein
VSFILRCLAPFVLCIEVVYHWCPSLCLTLSSSSFLYLSRTGLSGIHLALGRTPWTTRSANLKTSGCIAQHRKLQTLARQGVHCMRRTGTFESRANVKLRCTGRGWWIEFGTWRVPLPLIVQNNRQKETCSIVSDTSATYSIRTGFKCWSGYTDYRDRRFSWFSSVLPAKCQISLLSFPSTSFIIQFSLTERDIVQTVLVLVSWSGVRLCPLDTSPTIWPLAQVPDDGWWWVWNSRWNDWQGKRIYWDKTCASATLSTTNPTWRDSGSNPGRRGGKPAINCLSSGTALSSSG